MTEAARDQQPVPTSHTQDIIYLSRKISLKINIKGLYKHENLKYLIFK